MKKNSFIKIRKGLFRGFKYKINIKPKKIYPIDLEEHEYLWKYAKLLMKSIKNNL
jgi:hypothetical protein